MCIFSVEFCTFTKNREGKLLIMLLGMFNYTYNVLYVEFSIESLETRLTKINMFTIFGSLVHCISSLEIKLAKF